MTCSVATLAGYPASNVTDENRSTFSHPADGAPVGAYFQTDLGVSHGLDRIVLFNRNDGAAPKRLSNYRVQLLPTMPARPARLIGAETSAPTAAIAARAAATSSASRTARAHSPGTSSASPISLRTQSPPMPSLDLAFESVEILIGADRGGKKQTQWQWQDRRFHFRGGSSGECGCVTAIGQTRRETQCGRSAAPVRSVAERPTDLASHRRPKCRCGGRGSGRPSDFSRQSPLPWKDRGRSRRATPHGTSPGTTRRCCHACRAVPTRWRGSCQRSRRD